MILDGLADGTLNRPQGFGGSGRIAVSFMGAGEALVIIFRGSGEQAHSFGDLGSPAKK